MTEHLPPPTENTLLVPIIGAMGAPPMRVRQSRLQTGRMTKRFLRLAISGAAELGGSIVSATIVALLLRALGLGG